MHACILQKGRENLKIANEWFTAVEKCHTKNFIRK